MLQIGIIGIGNAGNQVAELAKKTRGIPGIAINSSDKDLINVTSIDKIIVGDEKGAGKDRSEAKNFVKQSIQQLLTQETVKSFMDNTEIVFVVSSTGGGTGSGMSPVLTDIFSRVYSSKKFIIVEILPPVFESIAAQQNTIDFLQEVRSCLPDITYMCYDNHRVSMKPTDQMMRTVNEQIVEDLCVIRGEYQYPTPYASIDEKDMLKILESPGRLTIVRSYNMKEKDLDDKDIEDILINYIKNISTSAELDRDKIVKRMGLITNLGQTIHQGLNFKLDKVKEFAGEPVEGFEHIYINEKNDDPNRVIVLLSGLSVPDDRIQKILDRIQEAMDAINKTKVSSVLDSVNTSGIGELRDTNSYKIQPAEINFTDIFSKYDKK